MKHPFHTLYYVGLTILISFTSLGVLLIYNISNVISIVGKEKTSKIHSDLIINPLVLETSTPKPKIEVQKQIPTKTLVENTKPQVNITPPNSGDTGNVMKKDTLINPNDSL